MAIQIEAGEKWNDADIDVEIGDEVEITASGTWYDSGIQAGPEGFFRWWLWPVGWTRRCASARWFELIAVVGRFDGPYHRIGRDGRFVATRAGRIYLFANDNWFRYGNNRGAISATVRTTPRAG